jgi:hypothetical protein
MALMELLRPRHSQYQLRCIQAAEKGDIGSLQLFLNEGRADFGRCLSECASAIVKGGHLEVLQWFHTEGLELFSYMCAGAASGGHLNILQWLLENGCPWDKQACAEKARLCGHNRVAQWIEAQD